MKISRHFALIAAIIGFSACLSITLGTVRYEPGIYDGVGRGFRGPIHVRVQVSSAGIEDIEIVEHNEDTGAETIEELRDIILETGYIPDILDIDGISGATLSGRGFLDAVEDALYSAVRQRPE